MNKKNTVLVILLAVATAFLCVAIYINKCYRPEKHAKVDIGDTSIVTVDGGTNQPITDPFSDFDVEWKSKLLEDKYLLDGETLISRTVLCPEISINNCTCTEKINTALRSFCNKLVKITGESKNSALEKFTSDFGEFEQQEFSADFEIGLYKHYISFLFDCNDYGGGADYAHCNETVCFDMNTGNEAVISEISSAAIEYAINEITSLIDKSPEDFYTDSKEILYSLDISKSFFFDTHGITVYINPGIISPSVFGSVKIPIPKSIG